MNINLFVAFFCPFSALFSVVNLHYEKQQDYTGMLGRNDNEAVQVLASKNFCHDAES